MASGKSEETVKVMVRIRPMNRTEKERGKKNLSSFVRLHFSGGHVRRNKKCIHWENGRRTENLKTVFLRLGVWCG